MVIPVDRAFVRIDEGLVHYRHAGEAGGGVPLPLYMVHAGPGSSAGLEPLVAELGDTRRVIAPDTLGNGDSPPPAKKDPDLSYYADSVCRVLDALGLDKVDYYGSHTGAHIGCELAIAHPDRIGKMIFDGIALFEEDLKPQLLAHYAPEMEPDQFGQHLTWAWHFVRDQAIHFPYFMRDPEHRLVNAVPPAAAIHKSVVEVLKSVTTYHYGYRAVFRHNTRERLPAVKPPVLFLASERDPLHIYLDDAAALLPESPKKLIGREEGPAGRIQPIVEFLDG